MTSTALALLKNQFAATKSFSVGVFKSVSGGINSSKAANLSATGSSLIGVLLGSTKA